MPTRRNTSPKRQSRSLFLVGAGLILIGVAAGVLVFGAGGEAQSAVGTGAGVIPLAVEYPAPELTLPALDGVEYSLTDYRGEVVLVNNWATWCPPCKAEMPTLQAYYDRHRDDGFTLIAIEAGDDTASVKQFAQEYGLTFPVWVDQGMRALDAFRNQSLPSSYVIDRQGTIRYAWTGPITEKMLEKFITPLIEE